MVVWTMIALSNENISILFFMNVLSLNSYLQLDVIIISSDMKSLFSDMIDGLYLSYFFKYEIIIL